ncbi:hypothetical protein [Actinokineospora inagensis]|uniref:endonuclease toxin domain-containing protein n=1 Tax=Actinokineospora inagensis TaxID=103730 RepID=UPI000423C0E5|nr:hypothetical protein [Actinokineospora inagensis]
MTRPIKVDTSTYEAASKVFGVDIHAALSKAGADLESGLSGQGGMAGADPGGSGWADSYDEVAKTVHSLVSDLGTASTTLAGLLQQSGFNHGQAEDASNADKSVPTAPDDSTYTAVPEPLADLPSAHGGSVGPPGLWWLVEHTVGYVWPDGDPDRLRRAAQAWTTAAGALDGAAGHVPAAVSGISSQQSPEVNDATTVCQGLGDNMGTVAAACRDLAKSCTDLAAQVDKAHNDIEDELISLAEWTAGIEAGGALVGFFTAGIGEGAAQAVEATRVAATATRIGKIIEALIEVGATIARAVGTVVGRVAEAAQRLEVILGARLSKAVATVVSKIPGVGKTAADDAFEGLSAWTLGWSQRGLEIEARLGGNLPRSFPTIDKFENGVATSIKSVDLSAATYQNTSALTSRLAGYVDKVSGFNGATFDGTVIRSGQVTDRVLQVAIQPGVASPAQRAVLTQLQAYATSKNVRLIVSEVS